MSAKKRGGRWVDFRQVKEQVRFKQVLEYGLLEGLRRKGEELVTARCMMSGDTTRTPSRSTRPATSFTASRAGPVATCWTSYVSERTWSRERRRWRCRSAS